MRLLIGLTLAFTALTSNATTCPNWPAAKEEESLVRHDALTYNHKT